MRSTAATPSPSNVARVGFIGLGDMGGALAARIIGAGFPTVLWARRAEALRSFSGPTVETAGTPAELAARVDLIGICVWDDKAVWEVVGEHDGVLAGCRPGTVIAIHSTIEPDMCLELATAAAEQGAVILDAPVSGGRDVALTGKLVVAVGGDREVLERSRPVLASFGDPVIHLGALGAGQLAKLVNNALLAANLALAHDALRLAASRGLQPDAMAQVLRHGSGRSFALDVAVASRSSAEVRNRAVPPLSKDVRCLNAVLRRSGDATALRAAAEAGLQRLSDPACWTW
ncbi:3-hydroxyisobutyrate dehydrogenase-like beta-hydroxyacid dehydrogenase [Mycobacterium sp. BK086]|uniref:NAD(P)-dependent oxidoreductase n=1 Tax=Mycobacterium sp. BK086 TaxID=2512165 RepID=UPI00105F1232|nr:NAD(P)-dependent oxidoreductase [Mycobacterium sp. BK086]TDO06379.1 3-hydroxyisobutyrate dehydrogenase-like beta-hydroxyacid dehydrogenase [Mycobacterium sp. BK086]